MVVVVVVVVVVGHNFGGRQDPVDSSLTNPGLQKHPETHSLVHSLDSPKFSQVSGQAVPQKSNLSNGPHFGAEIYFCYAATNVS